MKKLKGFTLIELIVVIGIIAILAAAAIVAINPSRQFANSRHAVRTGHVEQILNALAQYAATSATGTYPTEVQNLTNANGIKKICIPSGDNTPACTSGGGANEGVTFETEIVPDYIAQIPRDPQLDQTGDDSGYNIEKQTNGTLRVCAPLAASDTVTKTICLTR